MKKLGFNQVELWPVYTIEDDENADFHLRLDEETYERYKRIEKEWETMQEEIDKL